MSSIPPSCSAILENFQATGPERHSCWGPGTKLPSLRAAMENAEVSPIFWGIESRGNIGFNMMRHGFHQQNEDVAWKTLRFSPDHWWNNEEVTHLPGTYQGPTESCRFLTCYVVDSSSPSYFGDNCPSFTHIPIVYCIMKIGKVPTNPAVKPQRSKRWRTDVRGLLGWQA